VRTGKGFAVRPVTLGHSDGETVEIVAGLAPGEQIAVTNTFILKAEIGKSEAAHDH
jgi:cobalt-zinc-cadmium efflux system membrane fusion protein